MRCTLNSVPGDYVLLKQSCMPFAAVVQPLAEAKPGDDLIQVPVLPCAVIQGPHGQRGLPCSQGPCRIWGLRKLHGMADSLCMSCPPGMQMSAADDCTYSCKMATKPSYMQPFCSPGAAMHGRMVHVTLHSYVQKLGSALHSIVKAMSTPPVPFIA